MSAMDSAGFNVMLRAICGEDTPDPAVFADAVLHRIKAELGVLRECLLSHEPDLLDAADGVWAMRQRIEAAIDLIEMLRQREAA